MIFAERHERQRGKAKFLGLLAGVLKWKTLATMLLSIGAYAIEWGWLFALGFVLLIFVHEAGHAVALRMEGIPAGAPGVHPVRRRVRRDAGPAPGRRGGGQGGDGGRGHGLGHTAVLLNLFNLVPVPPLDGIAGAFTRTYWVIGYAVGAVALLVTGSPLLLLVLVIGLWTLVRRWRALCPATTPCRAGSAR